MSIENGWFIEKNDQWPGQANGLEIEEMLFETRTKFQDLKVFRSKTWGKVLTLDGVIQLTERDECSYQEMMAHVPMFSHPEPKKVLIIGGGDGGVSREVCKHKIVEEIIHVDIDEGVVNASKKFFPKMSTSFNDPRVTLHIGDGVKFVQDYSKQVMGGKASPFDVMIVDSSDPVGPAEKLFSPEFYKTAFHILSDAGILCTQGECYWLDKQFMRDLIDQNARIFTQHGGSAEYATISVPTYPCGQISAFVVSKHKKTCQIPEGCETLQDIKTKFCKNILPRRLKTGEKLEYYNGEVHFASFILPAFANRALYAKL